LQSETPKPTMGRILGVENSQLLRKKSKTKLSAALHGIESSSGDNTSPKPEKVCRLCVESIIQTRAAPGESRYGKKLGLWSNR